MKSLDPMPYAYQNKALSILHCEAIQFFKILAHELVYSRSKIAQITLKISTCKIRKHVPLLHELKTIYCSPKTLSIKQLSYPQKWALYLFLSFSYNNLISIVQLKGGRNYARGCSAKTHFLNLHDELIKLKF